jgi:hypothetical protein
MKIMLVKILSRDIFVSMLRNHVAINIHTVYCCTEQHLSCYIQVLLVNNTVFILTSTFLMILKNIKHNRPAVLKDNMVEGNKKLHHATNSELKTVLSKPFSTPHALCVHTSWPVSNLYLKYNVIHNGQLLIFLRHMHYVFIQADQFQIFTWSTMLFIMDNY